MGESSTKVRKFIRFLLSNNFDELLVVTSFILIGFTYSTFSNYDSLDQFGNRQGTCNSLERGSTHRGCYVANSSRSKGRSTTWNDYIHSCVCCSAIWNDDCNFLLEILLNWRFFRNSRSVAFMHACIFELVVVWNCRSERRMYLRLVSYPINI